MDILIIGGVILAIVLMSKHQKEQALKRQQEAEREDALRAARMARRAIKYPQLQLLGFVVILAGIALAGASYLMTRGLADPLSLAGIAIFFLGLSFIVLARQRVNPPGKVAKNAKGSVDAASNTKSQPQMITKPVVSIRETQIKPDDMADFRRYQKEKLAEEIAEFREYQEYQLFKSKGSQGQS
jgi:hypothetical protein